MNPSSSDGYTNKETNKQRRAHSQSQRHGNPVVCEREQSANTVRQAIAREEPGVQGHESEQQAAAREDPGVQGRESLQRSAAREEPGVREQRREQEQPANTRQ